MEQELVDDSWLGNWEWGSSKEAPETEKNVIGVLAFEVVGFMSKIVDLWHFLSDKETWKLTAEIGIQKLVSDDASFLMELVLNEIMENFGLISTAAGRLGKKCIDPVYARFEQFVCDPIENCTEWVGWEYRPKSMERRVKKMERFIAVTIQLSQELDVLAELEQTNRRIRANPETGQVRLIEFQQKVMLQHQEVENLQELSPWVRTYDYIVRLLVRSLLTILERIKVVFEIDQQKSVAGLKDHVKTIPDCLPWNRSFTAAVHPSENVLRRFSTRHDSKQLQHHHQPSVLPGKHTHSKSKRLSSIGPFKGCVMSGGNSPVIESCKPAMCFTSNSLKMDKEKSNIVSLSCSNKIYNKLALFGSKPGLLNAPPTSLGHAALALHYANVIATIEKLASSLHKIDSEDKNHLYIMLPENIRAALRARLKKRFKSHVPFAYKPSTASKWNQFLTVTLEWLSPLAHNMIRWHSARNFQRDHKVSGANVLLVQTLYFADQAKTEAVIIKLLLGLNYIYRVNKQLVVDASSKDNYH